MKWQESHKGVYGDAGFYYDVPTLGLDNSNIQRSSIYNLNPPHQPSMSTAPPSRTDNAQSSKIFDNPPLTTATQNVRFKEFVPNIAKWYG